MQARLHLQCIIIAASILVDQFVEAKFKLIFKTALFVFLLFLLFFLLFLFLVLLVWF